MMTDHETNSPPPARRFGRIALVVAGIGIVGIGAVGAVAAAGGPGGMMMRGGFGGFERALSEVDATQAQTDQIRSIVGGAIGDIFPEVWALQGNRAEAMALLGAETIDRDAIEALRRETLAALDGVTERALDAILDAAEVLSPEQRAELIANGPAFGPGRPGS